MAEGGRPFHRVLIANRGEIAVRIIRACRELGIETVAVYSDADRGAGHVRAADVAVRIGPAAAAESYLSIDAIVDAARATGADAIHPGYGFLAERAAFAAAVAAAGFAFVGPSSTTIAALGDKLAARRLARSVGVPVVPGTLEPAPIDDPEALAATLAAAEGIGFPLMVKTAAGGGGRGMREATDPAALPAALASASAEALAAFGDGSVYLERVIRPARHVEVQLLGDATGQVSPSVNATAPSSAATRSWSKRRPPRGSLRPPGGSSTTWRPGWRSPPAWVTPRRPSSCSTRRAASGSSRSTPGSRSNMA